VGRNLPSYEIEAAIVIRVDQSQGTECGGSGRAAPSWVAIALSLPLRMTTPMRESLLFLSLQIQYSAVCSEVLFTRTQAEFLLLLLRTEAKSTRLMPRGTPPAPCKDWERTTNPAQPSIPHPSLTCFSSTTHPLHLCTRTAQFHPAVHLNFTCIHCNQHHFSIHQLALHSDTALLYLHEP
jgi:hypothetical protein